MEGPRLRDGSIDGGRAAGAALARLIRLGFRLDPVLAMGRIGRWRWPWALAGLFFTSSLFLALGYAAALVESEAEQVGWGSGVPDSVFPIDPARPLSYFFLVLASLPFLLAPLIALVLVHGQSWRRAFSWRGSFRWDQFAAAAAAFFVVALLGLAVGLVLEPQQYYTPAHAWPFAFWALLALGVVFVQSLGEEVLFRGYFVRVIGAVVPLRLPVTAAILAAFVAGHLSNEDIHQDLAFNILYFVVVEAISYALLFRTQNLGASAGLHWMNNVMALFSPTVPGQPTALGLVVYIDPIYMEGGTRLFDLLTHAASLLGVALLLVLLLWRRSPLYIEPAPPPDLISVDETRSVDARAVVTANDES